MDEEGFEMMMFYFLFLRRKPKINKSALKTNENSCEDSNF